MSDTDVLSWLSRHPNEGWTRQQISEGSGQNLGTVDSALFGTRFVENGFVSDKPKAEWTHVVVIDNKWVWRDENRLESVVEDNGTRKYYKSGVSREDIIAYAKTHRGEPLSVRDFLEHFKDTGISRAAMNTALIAAMRHDSMFRRAKRGEYQYGGRIAPSVKESQPVQKASPKRNVGVHPQQAIVNYMQSHPDQFVTLDLMESETGAMRASISSTLSNLVKDKHFPVERVAAGIYRWNSSGVVSQESAMTAYTEYAQITTGSITLFVGNGEVWEGTRLR